MPIGANGARDPQTDRFITLMLKKYPRSYICMQSLLKCNSPSSSVLASSPAPKQYVL